MPAHVIDMKKQISEIYTMVSTSYTGYTIPIGGLCDEKVKYRFLGGCSDGSLCQ